MLLYFFPKEENANVRFVCLTRSWQHITAQHRAKCYSEHKSNTDKGQWKVDNKQRRQRQTYCWTLGQLIQNEGTVASRGHGRLTPKRGNTLLLVCTCVLQGKWGRCHVYTGSTNTSSESSWKSPVWGFSNRGGKMPNLPTTLNNQSSARVSNLCLQTSYCNHQISERAAWGSCCSSELRDSLESTDWDLSAHEADVEKHISCAAAYVMMRLMTGGTAPNSRQDTSGTIQTTKDNCFACWKKGKKQPDSITEVTKNEDEQSLVINSH